jgi:exopolysaccharide production protein ExoQ
MKKLALLEKIFTIVTLTLFTGAPLVVLLSGGSSQGDGVDTDFVVINIIFAIIYCITFCLLILRWKKVVVAASYGWLIWLLMGFAILSISWSVLPNITLSRVIALVGTIVFSLYFASRYTIKEQIELIGWTLGITGVMSLVFSLALPQYGQMTGVHFGLWRGAYPHKNVLGKIMVVASLSFLVLAFRKQKQQYIYWGFFVLSVFLLLMSKSSSPLINLIILITAFFILPMIRWRYSMMIPTLAAISLISIVLYSALNSNANLIANIFNKDLTLTGRTDLWTLVLDKIGQQPWLGYGFGAFWHGFDGPSAYIWSAIAFEAPNAHNGYLDLLLELGVFGFVIYLMQFVVGCLKAISYIRFNRTSDGLWPGLVLIYTFLSNLTESGLFIQNNFFLILQLSTFISLGLARSKHTSELLREHSLS